MPFQPQPLSAAAPVSQRIDRCRSCGSSHLSLVLDLGALPLANRLLGPDDNDADEPYVPLTLVFCSDCSLVQITDTVAPEILFRQYPYCSSFSDEVLSLSKRHAESLVASRRLQPSSLVVELASNDGYLLQYFVAAGIPVLGVEPAVNVAAIARQRQVPTRTEFFGFEAASAMRREGIAADVVIAKNVLAHVADINGFVAGVREILKADGVAQLEFPYVRNMVDQTQFDTIYHEHLCYLSATAVDHLARRNGLVFTDVEEISIHGGSLRVTLARRAAPTGRKRVDALLDAEQRLGLHQVGYYRALSDRVDRLRDDLARLLGDLKRQGARLVGYGASAKGAILLNAFGIGPNVLEYLVDRSSLKQGKLAPGTRLPIVSPDRLLQDRPDYALLLAWNFADEVLEQQAAYRAAGGRFIVPIPKLAIV